MKDLLIFDMDGVLVDVTDSYRAAIQATVKNLTGDEPSPVEIQDWKNRGGWNDDWLLSTEMIRQRGHNIPYQQVVEHFQKLFHGDGTNGLILRERWLATEGLFDRLATNHTLAVFTGRPREEADLTLKRFGGGLTFSPIVAMEDVANHKPAPDGLLQIARENPDTKLFYVGDSIDDARSARAARVPFIGIAAPANPRYVDLAFLFQQENAYAIVDDINYLNEVFPA